MNTPTPMEFERLLRRDQQGTILPPLDSLSGPGRGARIDSIDIDAIVKAGEEALALPVVAPRFSDYTPYEARGSRAEADAALGSFMTRLAALSMAECIERQGRFLEAVQDAVFAACEITSWMMVAHSDAIPRPTWREGAYKPGDPLPDLMACMTAARFATIVHLLGNRLHPVIRERMVHEVDRRVFKPLESAQPWWVFGASNWNGVCAGARLSRRWS